MDATVFIGVIFVATVIAGLTGYLIGRLMKPAPKVKDYSEDVKRISDMLLRVETENKGLYENIGSLQTLLSSKEKDLDVTSNRLAESEARLVQEAENNRRILSMKKSSEIRTGHIAEQLAPFLAGFKYDPKNLKYLGQPIDYIVFGKDKITFIEVKSGKSHLSHNQKHIRQLIADKKVEFEEFRVRGVREGRRKRRNNG
jgi:predicted Holliday junction resolvase-like endonuclease